MDQRPPENLWAELGFSAELKLWGGQPEVTNLKPSFWLCYKSAAKGENQKMGCTTITWVAIWDALRTAGTVTRPSAFSDTTRNPLSRCWCRNRATKLSRTTDVCGKTFGHPGGQFVLSQQFCSKHPDTEEGKERSLISYPKKPGGTTWPTWWRRRQAWGHRAQGPNETETCSATSFSHLHTGLRSFAKKSLDLTLTTKRYPFCCVRVRMYAFIQYDTW